jgi:hypothetical protein
MSMLVQQPPVVYVTNQYALAKKLLATTTLPKECFRGVFDRVMLELEGVAKTRFGESVKKRVWSIVSPEKVNTLREFYLLQFCEKILGGFRGEEVEKMLVEYERTNTINSLILSEQLRHAHDLYQDALTSSLELKVNSLTKAWIAEIVKALEKEGFTFPKHR